MPGFLLDKEDLGNPIDLPKTSTLERWIDMASHMHLTI